MRSASSLPKIFGQRRSRPPATNAVTAVNSGGRVPSSSGERESQDEDESLDGDGWRCSDSLGRWCYVDGTIGFGWFSLL
jgi:hypothetical protein